MPEVSVGALRWSVPATSNLLDALNTAGLNVPYSCRAGSCHVCLVRCVSGELADRQPDALDAPMRAEGWRLACQCAVIGDVEVAVFDPMRDGTPTQVQNCDWPSPGVLRLRLQPQQPVRYAAGQHVVLWTAEGVARPYSLASVPQEDRWLEFHIDCRRPGKFADAARRLMPGDPLRLGELHGGALHYDPSWQDQPLWLLAAGTGLAPLFAVLREALRQGHQGAIRVVHLAPEAGEHYLAAELQALAAQHANVQVQLVFAQDLAAALAGLRTSGGQPWVLVCGSPETVELWAKRLFLAGVKRNRLFTDVFTPRV